MRTRTTLLQLLLIPRRKHTSRSGKNPFSGEHSMYTILPYCDVPLSISPVCRSHAQYTLQEAVICSECERCVGATIYCGAHARMPQVAHEGCRQQPPKGGDTDLAHNHTRVHVHRIRGILYRNGVCRRLEMATACTPSHSHPRTRHANGAMRMVTARSHDAHQREWLCSIQWSMHHTLASHASSLVRRGTPAQPR